MVYLIVAVRIVTAMALLLLLILKTGRRKIGELPVYDFLSIIVIGSVVGADISEPDIPHLPVLFAVIVMVALQYIVSCLLINNKKIAKKITFGPTLIIQKGELIKQNLERVKYSVENVRMALREKGVFDLNEVEYAILEGSGSISFLKKSQFLPLTPSDMNMKPSMKGLSVPLITDGAVHDNNLAQLNVDRQWLYQQLGSAGVKNFEEVFYADINTEGKIYISKIIQAPNPFDNMTL